jgi:hypothetical protein
MMARMACSRADPGVSAQFADGMAVRAPDETALAVIRRGGKRCWQAARPK